jgi:ATP-dependent DNA helicase RecG
MLKDPIRFQKGVGPKLADVLSNVGIETIKDLVNYFPREYEDRSNPTSIIKLQAGVQTLIRAKVSRLTMSRTRRNFAIVKGILSDGSGHVGVVWFNQPFILRVLKPGDEIFVSGRLDRDQYSGEMVFVPRNYELVCAATVNEPIVPIYNLTEGLFQKVIRNIARRVIQSAIEEVEDPLPQDIKDKYKLIDLKKALLSVHFPQKMDEVASARRRLAFDELLVFQFGLVKNRTNIEKKKGIPFTTEGELITKFVKSLPFKFTGAQQRVMDDILVDMKSQHVMNRLIQGDVGSGKTIVALYAMLVAVQSGYQAAIMAPTEILANQHYAKISSIVAPLGIETLLLTGSEKDGRKEIMEKLSSGKPLIIVGTHALIVDKVDFGKLGMIVIDEQHRFGVEQRLKLRKKGEALDLLVMTATPIPRTLALTLYGDLDRSIIDEMPPGRTPITTKFIPANERQKLYEFIRAQVIKGRQAFVVCPLVEISEKIDLKAAKEESELLQKVFPEFKVGLVHGRLKGPDKDKVMSKYVANEVQILVSTTVIEVGIDVPNSTIMVIEHAERFGLSQLHQLRGRIGRGDKSSYCFLLGDPRSETAKARIEAMLKTQDGFKIAEADLKLRGPGEFFGLAQSGLPNFRVADIINDEKTVREAREAAEILLKKGTSLKQFNVKFWDTDLE